MGANDAAYGALIHYIEQYYNLTYLIVSLIFLSPFVGYTTSAFMNNWIHHKFGQRGVAFIGPVCHLIACEKFLSFYPKLLLAHSLTQRIYQT